MKKLILSIFTLLIVLVSCNKIVEEVKDKTLEYTGVQSKVEFYDLAKKLKNEKPFSLLSNDEIKSFGESMIFDSEGEIIGASAILANKLSEEDYNLLIQKTFEFNPYSYGEKDYNTYGNPSYITPEWVHHQSPKGPGQSCVMSHDDWCKQTIIRYIIIDHN